MIAPPEARRVLIATIGLLGRGGTDTYTRDLALALLRRGWLPIIYTTIAGEFAEELRAATVPIVNSIEAVGAPPDVIHGHHHIETLAAMARFPGVPTLFMCHDAITWHSVPPQSSRIGAYVAVDRNCRDRMIFEHGIAEESIQVMGNAVDLRRFTPRPPLPTRPTRALVLSNTVTANDWGATLRSACRQRGITLDLAGAAADAFVNHPEELLARYDLVFGKGRCALEGMASGAAVIVCDERGLSGMVTSGDLPAARHLNFGLRTLQQPMTVENILHEIDRYDAVDAARVSARIRASADIDLLAGELIELYEELIAAKTSLPAEEEMRSMAGSLERLLPLLYGRPTPPTLAGRLQRRLTNSRMLAYPARLLYQLKRRLGV
ncbi:MAG TPA: glycosyltransferase family 4 protein [Thermoanaerobaculia bacterium]|nr:glycosyltransferase family 4 protein [Thermoanaerobaculia bacterium]